MMRLAARHVARQPAQATIAIGPRGEKLRDADGMGRGGMKWDVWMLCVWEYYAAPHRCAERTKISQPVRIFATWE